MIFLANDTQLPLLYERDDDGHNVAKDMHRAIYFFFQTGLPTDWTGYVGMSAPWSWSDFNLLAMPKPNKGRSTLLSYLSNVKAWTSK